MFIRVDRPDHYALSTSSYGDGTNPIVFNEYDGYPFADPNIVSVWGAIETQAYLPGYRGVLRLVGPGVSW